MVESGKKKEKRKNYGLVDQTITGGYTMANCIMCGKSADNYPGYITDGVIAVCNNCAASNSLTRIMTRIENLGLSANLKSVFSPLIEVGLVNQTDEHVELDKGKLDAKRELNEKYGMVVHVYTDEGREDKDKYQPDSDYMNGVKAYLESGLVNQTDEAGNIADIKQRVDGLYDVCRILWESSHDKCKVRDKYSELVKRLTEETGFSTRELGLPDPPYIRNDGTIGEVPASILSGGYSTDEDCELEDDIETMSQDDFYSKYAGNLDALNAYHDYNGEPSKFMEV